ADAAADHVAAMNASGLTVDARGGSWTARVRAVTPDRLGSQLGLVLLAVKSQHTGAALDTLAPRLAGDGVIVSLQNGLNEELIADRVGAERTIGCLVNWAADWTAPGRIQHGGTGAFVVGELDGASSPRVKELAALLEAVTDTRVTDNILGYKWAKHVYAALLIATAVVDAHGFEVVEAAPPIQRMLGAPVAEALALAAGGGGAAGGFGGVRSDLGPGRGGRRRRRGGAQHGDDREPLPGAHQDEDGDLAGPGRPEAPDRGPRLLRRDPGQGRATGPPDAADATAGRADRRAGGRSPGDGLGKSRRAGRAEPHLTPPRGRS